MTSEGVNGNLLDSIDPDVNLNVDLNSGETSRSAYYTVSEIVEAFNEYEIGILCYNIRSFGKNFDAFK